MHEVNGTRAASTGPKPRPAIGATAARSGTPQMVVQQAAIAQIGQLALEERSLEALLRELCELVQETLHADLVSVAQLAADGRSATVVAGLGWRQGVVSRQILPISGGSQAGYILAKGGPVIVDDYAAERRFEIVAFVREHKVKSGMSVRIGAANAPFGILAVFSRRIRQFTAHDANFMRAVANVLGAAVRRQAAERELRNSRDQLAAIVESIDEGITVRDKAGLVFANQKAAQLTGFATAAELIASVDEVQDKFELFDEAGNPTTLDALPGRRALAGEDAPEQVVGFRFGPGEEMRWSVVRGIGLRDPDGVVQSVISIFRDITDERWGQATRDYMSEAVAALSSTLDVDEAAQRLASLSVPRLADYVTVSILQPDRSIKLVALAHINPQMVEIIRGLERTLPPTDPDAGSGSAHVIRDNVVETGTVSAAVIDALPLPEEQRALLQQLSLRDYVTVPLTGRGRPIGALSLAMAESGRKLLPRDIELARELGIRAGIALENARLYQAVDARREEVDAVLAALSDAVLVFDSAGRLRMGNAAARQTFQGNLPRSLDELAERAAVEGDSVDGSPHEVEIDGRGQWHELRRYNAKPDDAEGEALAVVVLRDVTSVRSTRAARDAFMGVLSHELRTPVTTIYGGSQLLTRALDEDRRKEIVDDIREESERLIRLVQDLLVMSRVEHGMVEIDNEPVLLQRLLAAVIKSKKAKWPRVHISLTAGGQLPTVRGDATYVEQVVRNLLTNALRYGQGLEHGIEVIAQEAGDEVEVRVLDRGNGLGGEQPDRLFELFYRSSSARSVPGGAGIGLFVCRTLIEKMGGRIWASEREGGGAEFGFTLPVMNLDAAI